MTLCRHMCGPTLMSVWVGPALCFIVVSPFCKLCLPQFLSFSTGLSLYGQLRHWWISLTLPLHYPRPPPPSGCDLCVSGPSIFASSIITFHHLLQIFMLSFFFFFFFFLIPFSWKQIFQNMVCKPFSLLSPILSSRNKTFP